ncbi:MAG: ABC transporter ATP-binding protein/permease [Treponemataceae bacterium]|nr:ABC transporter ATP-binding protein/permease [Treponemataceae bacterium]
MAFNAYNQDEKTEKRSARMDIVRVFSYLLKYKGRILAVLLLIAFGTFVSLLNPVLIEKAIDEYIAAKDMGGLVRIALLAIALNLLMIGAIKLRMMIMARTSNRVIEEIRDDLYCHVQSLDLPFFDSRPSGKILARLIGDINSMKPMLENSITSFIPGLVTVVCVGVIMFTKNAKLALAALSSLPPLVAGIVLISLKAEKHWRLFRKKSSNLGAFINEDFSGIKTIHNFDAENETSSTFDTLTEEHRTSFVDAVKWCDAFGSVIDLCWAAGTFALFYVGIKVLGVESVSIGTYISFAWYIGMFWQPVMNISNFYNQFVNAASGAERIFEIMDSKAIIKDADDAGQMPEIHGNVEFKDVCFEYDKGTPVLENVSFKVEQGETIALVGPTGAGKSTIVNLIARFYDVQSGEVLIDGTDVKSVTLESLRSQMGIMTQDNYVFSGTIRDNIRYGKLDATEEEIVAAAKAVHAHDFICQLEKGYDTELTARGGELSNGQRQLLAFARTMVSKPRILILDEATSSIDTKTEQLVQAGIAALLKGRTSFVIAHRLSTIQNADRIFVVDKGGILERGTPDELMAKKGLYYELLEASKE